MEIVEENLVCDRCGHEFVHTSSDRIEHCSIVGSKHIDKIISWDRSGRVHEIPCVWCGHSDHVRFADEGTI